MGVLEVSVLWLFFTAFPGALAESWVRSRTAGLQLSSDMGCWTGKQQLILYHDVVLDNFFFNIMQGAPAEKDSVIDVWSWLPGRYLLWMDSCRGTCGLGVFSICLTLFPFPVWEGRLLGKPSGSIFFPCLAHLFLPVVYVWQFQTENTNACL